MTAPAPWVPKCPVCMRGNWKTHELMINHVAGHSVRSVARALNQVMRREHALKAELHVERYGAPTAEEAPPGLVCAGKEAFSTELEATTALLSTWAKSSVDPRRRETRVYVCNGPRGCGRYHLTSQEVPSA